MLDRADLAVLHERKARVGSADIGEKNPFAWQHSAATHPFAALVFDGTAPPVPAIRSEYHRADGLGMRFVVR
jgi:hypothetical protein